jgi:hypothetical protein
MSYNSDTTQLAYAPLPEDSIEGIRMVWGPIAAQSNIVSQNLIEAESQNLGAAELVQRIQHTLARFSLLSHHQTDYYQCELPFQLPHTFSRGYVCQSNSGHKFCLDHVLTKCVICGGDVEYE